MIHQKSLAQSDKNNIFIRMLNEPFLMISEGEMLANDCGPSI